jgi:uncharacterized membrane protein YhhN
MQYAECLRSEWRLYVSVCLSAIYIVTSGGAPFPGRFLVKAGSIAILAVFAVRNGWPALGAGLLLSSVGDAALDLSPTLFTVGLAAFLCAHLTYTVAFLRRRRREVPITMRRAAAIGGVVLFAMVLGVWVAPAAGALAVPVALYVVAITVMAASSIAARFESHWIPIGAVLFVASDAILATDRFRNALPMRDYAVWCTYYAGQLLIARGSARAAKVGQAVSPAVT